MYFIDNNGIILLSKDSKFALGFKPTENDVTLFLLVIFHQGSNTIVWTANRDFPVANDDHLVVKFGDDGSVSLRHGEKWVWVPNTGGKPVSAIELQDSGNLVMYGSNNSTIVWESFKHPTDTLLAHQDFVKGMQLSSNPDPSKGNLTYKLEIKSGDIVLSSGYSTPQSYWSMRGDIRKIINKIGVISSAKIESNSWNFYDESNALIWQFVFSPSPNSNANDSSWIAVLGGDGFFKFYRLLSNVESQMRIPSDQCARPEPCDAYLACSSNTCQCPTGLVSRSCNTGISDPCSTANDSVQLVNPGSGLRYFALGFSQPSMKSDLDGCKHSCAAKCSCLGLFFDNSSRKCFHFNRIGSFISDPTSKFSVFVKVLKYNAGERSSTIASGRSHRKLLSIVIMIIALMFFILVLAYGARKYHTKKQEVLESALETSEFNSYFTMPVRYSYKSLQEATNNFSEKLGQGGFGSVYQGKLPDGTLLAVKKLERVSQGKKEFQAEVSIIGSAIHHIHLVRLKGFCAEGSHRLLAYEFMANGSLDRWTFKRDRKEHPMLDWATRFNIAIGTAKGLAYLHAECELKIVHCDIKPENVLLDENFVAKVSDFGLAKLMTRKQSHIYTAFQGTHGYFAPERITNHTVSEKSDVYSYGMVLLEIIGGRKNYYPSLSSEESHFPAYAFKMMKEGNVREILDSNLEYEPDEESLRIAIKVAFWCIQEEMSMRPPMTMVVKMLEGICPVPDPPMPYLVGQTNNDGTRTGSSYVPSAVNLSEPR